VEIAVLDQPQGEHCYDRLGQRHEAEDGIASNRHTTLLVGPAIREVDHDLPVPGHDDRDPAVSFRVQIVLYAFANPREPAGAESELL
jgi:hypothetical protein